MPEFGTDRVCRSRREHVDRGGPSVIAAPTELLLRRPRTIGEWERVPYRVPSAASQVAGTPCRR